MTAMMTLIRFLLERIYIGVASTISSVSTPMSFKISLMVQMADGSRRGVLNRRTDSR